MLVRKAFCIFIVLQRFIIQKRYIHNKESFYRLFKQDIIKNWKGWSREMIFTNSLFYKYSVDKNKTKHHQILKKKAKQLLRTFPVTKKLYYFTNVYYKEKRYTSYTSSNKLLSIFLQQNTMKNCKIIDTKKSFLPSFHFLNIYYSEKVSTSHDKFLSFLATKYY